MAEEESVTTQWPSEIPGTPTLILDTVRDAVLEKNWDTSQIRVRTGLMKNIDIPLGATPDPTVLDRVANAINMPKMNDLDPGSLTSGRRLRRIRVEPISYNLSRVFMIYERPNPLFDPSIYVIRDDSYMASKQTNILPGSNKPIRATWTDPNDPNNAITDNVLMSLLMPMRAITVTRTVYGTPPADLRTNIGRVNSVDWEGLPPGYWLLNRLVSDLVRYGGSYTFTASAITKNSEDWSEYGVLRDNAGRYVQFSQADLTALRTMSYAYDVIPKNGIVKVGPYKTVAFGAIFGFGDSSGTFLNPFANPSDN